MTSDVTLADIKPAEPTANAESIELPQYGGLDWRIRLGMVGTVLWVLLLGIYISGALGWSNLPSVPMEILGSFLEGAFAPLAFLWFVLGYFSQQKELSQNTQAIRMQYVEMQKTAAQAVIQAEAAAPSPEQDYGAVDR